MTPPQRHMIRLVHPSSVEKSMIIQRKWQDHFIVDSEGTAFCKECGGRCKAILLRKFSMFWCGDHFCENTYELRLSQEGERSLHDYGSIHQDKDAMEEILKIPI